LAELPAKHIPAFTVELLKDYANSQLRPQGFLAYWEQRGRALALELTGKYSVIPAPEEAPDFYRDFGTEEDFSLAGRGPGECGAGIFELIAQELKKAEAEFLDAKQLVKETSERAQKLLHAVVLAAGALLVTRGIEPGNPDVALKEFERHFIDQGLADKKHLELLLLARSALRGKAQLLLDEEARIRALLDEVQALYDSMDAALNFPVKLKDQAEQKTCTFNKPPELNLRGVKCPMNFVRAKIALEQLEEGQVLEVILDEGEPINNVPASFRSQGQEVISITPEDADSYRVKIRRVK
jgi:sulfite reductase (ferredoxin)